VVAAAAALVVPAEISVIRGRWLPRESASRGSPRARLLRAVAVVATRYAVDRKPDRTFTTDSDPSFTQQLAGHLKTGRDSISDPAFGR